MAHVPLTSHSNSRRTSAIPLPCLAGLLFILLFTVVRQTFCSLRIEFEHEKSKVTKREGMTGEVGHDVEQDVLNEDE